MKKTKKRIDLPVMGAAPALVLPEVEGGTRVGVITLGCDKNTVDSERIMARLAGSGAQVSTNAEDADVIVINTCGFIDRAKEESIEALLDAVRLKQSGRVKAVVAMGCLVQRYKQDLVEEIPEIDAFLGLTEAEQLVPTLQEKGVLADRGGSLMELPLRLLSTDTPHSSYLKISEGCDHTCAFCAIPLMRGKHRSAPKERLVREAQELEQRGVVELNIVSQDTTWYGRDLARGMAASEGDDFIGHFPATNRVRTHGSALAHGRTGLLTDLLRQLIDETGIPWFRLFYMYPSGIQKDLVELMALQPRLLPYLDMPIQHGSDRMLKLMRRPERQRTIRERVQWLRAALPDLSLRTTLIVGFPGETDDDFEEMIGLLEEIRFDYIGAFPYSVEEGTLAAEMPDQVDEDVKRERLERLFDVQRGISQERNDARVGTVQTVLIDRVEEEAVGRTRGQALEVDGVVSIADPRGCESGDFVQVRITEAVEQDLIGQIIQEI
ncbi:MAG TPA: 30S ribosomal protein S12 methylthiotransferase RimO [Longimicrobiales bacterium]|nr:30S ribosomal protein S12 methylthiotransferase RimO [Longimicrobiales bacterium]